ncbi:MAG: hypothetical protein JJ873_16020 [Maricaulis sp.]|uniref:hypothetical protein n=2 Tax=Maricaulis sp. TaxID=1486257 RepID=UPI001B1B32AE|nr:hypothetical protein [Maricaulis sp.]MBO6730608.1 hypothetical protein [Maricaulis sp.]MBO6878892.1 hypothetical protein [Maricaulis sp.]
MTRFSFVEAVFFSVFYARANPREFRHIMGRAFLLALIPVAGGALSGVVSILSSPVAGFAQLAIMLVMIASVLLLPAQIALLWLQALTGRLPDRPQIFDFGPEYRRLWVTMSVINIILNILFWPLELLSGGGAVSFVFLPVAVWLLTIFAAAGAMSVRRQQIVVFGAFSSVKHMQLSASLAVGANLIIVLAISFVASSLIAMSGMQQLGGASTTATYVFAVGVFLITSFFMLGPGCYFVWLSEMREQSERGEG